jgi:rfaE bifunctional protein kinase chain/domain
MNPSSTAARRAPSFSRSALSARVGEFRGKRVIVVGDVILDRYLWGRATRVSPEAPVLVVDVEREEFRLGGAANVAHNVASLGAVPILFGVCGTDLASGGLAQLLNDRGVDPAAGMVSDAVRRTTVKTRIVAHHQQVLRADEETRDPLSEYTQALLLERVIEALSRADAVILSDYGKGVLSQPLVEALLPELVRRGLPTAVDPKEEQFFRYKGVTVITPNLSEASQAWGRRIRNEAELAEAGFGLREKLASRAVLITRGEDGMSLFDEDGHTHIPTKAREVFDVTGAGDTVVATIGVALAAHAPLAEASVLANHAAGLVVAHLGTAAATAGDLAASLQDLED